MNIRELINEAKERCPQCGMTDCTCAPGTCKCKPIAGWIPNKGFKKQGVAEGSLDEGALKTITALAKQIPGIIKYYQMAQKYKPQLIEILKTSKSGKEVKQKMEQLATGHSATVAESGKMKQLGGVAVGGGSILSAMWMNAMGMIDGVLAHATAGEVGGAVASGSILGLIPVTLMLFAAMLLFKGSKQGSDEKAQAFQTQRGQQGMAEDHEIQMADSELKSIYQNSRKLLRLIKHYSEQEGLEAWQQSKITKAADYLNSVLQAVSGQQTR